MHMLQEKNFTYINLLWYFIFGISLFFFTYDYIERTAFIWFERQYGDSEFSHAFTVNTGAMIYSFVIPLIFVPEET